MKRLLLSVLLALCAAISVVLAPSCALAALAARTGPDAVSAARTSPEETVSREGDRGADVRSLERSRSGHGGDGPGATFRVALSSAASTRFSPARSAVLGPVEWTRWQAPARARARLMVFLN